MKQSTDEITFFPIKILLVDSGKTRICHTTKDIPNKMAFKVLETNTRS